MKTTPYILPGLEAIPMQIEALNVQELVCKNLEIEPARLALKNRKRELVEARSLVFYILRRHDKKKWSFAKLGALYGLDHATVMWGIDVIKNLLQTSKDFRARVGTFMEIE